MTESLFLINPLRRKRKRKRPQPPALAAYWAKKRAQRIERRRKAGRLLNPRKKRRKISVRRRLRLRARHRNPRHRHAVYHRRRRKVYVRHRRSNPIRAHRRRRRNPFGSGEVKSVLIPGLYGAGGALAVAVAYGFASPYLPSALSTGIVATGVQLAASLGIGMLIGKFMGRSAGNAAAIGAVTVIAVNAITPYISSATGGSVPGMSGFGGLKLGGVGDYVPYRRAIGAYMPGKAMPTGRRGMGFISPAPRIGAYSPSMRRGRVGAYMPRVPNMRGLGAHDMSGGSGYNGLSDGM